MIAHLTRLARPLRDTVVRVTDAPGLLKRKTGDVVIEIDESITGGRQARLVLEVKRRAEGTAAFTAQMISSTLDASCQNRGADMAIFVTESASLLPTGIGYQELAPGRIAVAFEPAGDDTALAVAVGVLRSQLLVRLAQDGQLDLGAVRQALAAVRQNMGALEQARRHLTTARQGIEKASAVLDEIREQVLMRLGKLEALMS